MPSDKRQLMSELFMLCDQLRGKEICEKANVNYTVFRNAKKIGFEKMSNEKMDSLVNAVQPIIQEIEEKCNQIIIDKKEKENE